MSYKRGGRFFLGLAASLVVSLLTINAALQVSAAPSTIADPAFAKVWTHTDQQVLDGRTSRSWIWGPEPFTGALQEDYAEAPGGKRKVQFFDKSRMEINNPAADQSNPFFVTNGLLAREMISGQLQVGDTQFIGREPANIGVAGDIDDTGGPTYKVLKDYQALVSDRTGQAVNGAIDRAGATRDGAADFAKYNVTNAFFEPVTGHNIAAPFWKFLNQTGPVLDANGNQVNARLFEPYFYATGLPITEGWWAKVKVGGVVKDVLVQAYERRVLTFTPANDSGFQVEMGNIGRHYYLWRYNADPATSPPPSTSPTTGGTTSPSPTTPGTTSPSPTSGTPSPSPSVSTTPVPSSACLPPVSGGNAVQACVSNSQPKSGQSVTVYGRLVVGGQARTGLLMTTSWLYQNGQGSCSGVADSTGVANCTLGAIGSSPGYNVVILVKFSYNGAEYQTSTGYTQQ